MVFRTPREYGVPRISFISRLYFQNEDIHAGYRRKYAVLASQMPALTHGCRAAS
jgi:hypothetical protein